MVKRRRLPFNGGFLGVDVFFVISGFLITRNIVTQYEKGNFTFKEFYIRRARRIFPALFVTLLVSFILGCLLFSPEHLQRLGKSLIYSVASVSNFFFWGESGYFNTAEDFKPLLHTWSLSVEEQFYLVWLALLVALLTFKRTSVVITFLVLGSIVSVYFAEQWIANNDADGAFYLTPFRMSEFAIGALLVWLCQKRVDNKFLVELLALLGLFMIFYSIFTYTSETSFPGINALIPCVGTALLIYAGGNSQLIGRFVLSNKVFVGIGLISYSLYLVHWPLIVFYKYWNFAPLNGSARYWIIVACFILGYLLYRFIETPFRIYKMPEGQKRPLRYSFVVLTPVVVLTLALAAHTIYHDGWASRVDSMFSASKGKSFHVDYYGGKGYPNVGQIGLESQASDLLVVGDSFAHQYSSGFDKIFRENNLTAQVIFAHGCPFGPDITRLTKEKPVQNCIEKAAMAFDALKGNDMPLVIAQSWRGYMNLTGKHSGEKIEMRDNDSLHVFILDNLDKIRQIIGAERKLILIGSQPGSGQMNGVSTCVNRPSYIPSKCLETLPFKRIDGLTNDAIEAYANAHENTFYLNPFDALCDSEQCNPVDITDGKIWYSDGMHLSIDGSLRAAEYYSSELISLITTKL